MRAIDRDGLDLVRAVLISFDMNAHGAELFFAQERVALAAAKEGRGQRRQQIDIEWLGTNDHSASNKRNVVAK